MLIIEPDISKLNCSKKYLSTFSWIIFIVFLLPAVFIEGKLLINFLVLAEKYDERRGGLILLSEWLEPPPLLLSVPNFPAGLDQFRHTSERSYRCRNSRKSIS